MFRALVAKEWKEKSVLFFFGLGIFAVYLLAYFGLAGKEDRLEWLTYALLLLFFPFEALLLGSSGFETELRNDAWAFLFSRPVAKPVVWLVKYASLLGMLAVLWAAFGMIWLTVPGFGELIGGHRLLLGVSMRAGIPWLSLFLSVFLFTVAFTFSMLSARPFSTLFASFVVGVGLAGLVYGSLGSAAAGRFLLFAPKKAQGTLLVSLGLMSLAFAAASILTFARTDFSQPRKKTAGFAKRVAAFIVPALAAAAAWTTWAPNPGDRFIAWIGTSNGAPLFETERGAFRYSETRDRILWVAKGPTFSRLWPVMGAGKMAYVVNDLKAKTEVGEELWIASMDGSERKRVLRIGAGTGASLSPQDVRDCAPSQDGRRIALIAKDGPSRPAATRSPLWVVDADGSALTNLPLDPALGLGSLKRSWLRIVAWSTDGKNILIYESGPAKPAFSRLWVYDLELNSARPFVESDAVGPCVLSPDQKFMSVPFQSPAGGSWRLGVIDLRTLEMSLVAGEDINGFVDVTWSGQGDRLLFVVRKRREPGPDLFVRGIFSLAEKRVVAERELGTDERAALMGSGDWLEDDTRLVVRDGDENGLRILGPDLHEEMKIPLPASIRDPAGVYGAGSKVVVKDAGNDSLWRFDLRKRSWKRIY